MALTLRLVKGSALTYLELDNNFTGIINGTIPLTYTPTFTGIITAGGFNANAAVVPANGFYLPSANTVGFAANTTAVGTLTTAVMTMPTYAVTGATVPANGMYLSAANTLAFSSNTLIRASVNSTGNWVMPAASSGDTLTVSGTVVATAHVVTGSTVPPNGTYLPSANTLGFAANTTAVGSLTTAVMTMPTYAVTGATVPANGIYLSAANTLAFASNTTSRGTVNSTGNWSLVAPTAGVGLTVNGFSGTHSTKIADSAATLFDAGFLVLPVSASTTAALSDRGKGIVATGTITIPNAVFAAGDVLAIYNNSAAAITLTATITTMRLHGTATTGSRTLALRGFASIYFVSGTECVVCGDVT